MKKTKCLIYSLILFSVTFIFAAPATTFQTENESDRIIGKWESSEKAGRIIEVYKTGEKYFGKIIEDANGELKTGTIIINDFSYIGNSTWGGGKLFAPKRNKQFSGEIEMPDDNIMEITVSVHFSSKTVKWKRVK